MTSGERASVGDDYVLATGDEGAARLHLLDEVYGASSRAACAAAGLGAGWRVADVGCGVGDMSCWFAERVGPHGAVIAMDVSADQLVHGRGRAAREGLDNVSFVRGARTSRGCRPVSSTWCSAGSCSATSSARRRPWRRWPPSCGPAARWWPRTC